MMDSDRLINLDKSILFWFNGSNSMFVDGLALTLTSAYTWVFLYVALFYLVIRNNEKWSQIFLIVGACAFCLLLASGLSEGIVKPFVARPRPSLEPSLSGIVDLAKGYRGTGYSFFSAHAANTLSIAVFFSLLVRSRVFTIGMLSWSVVNCWTRLYLGVHYPSDILVGIVWGVLVGFLVYLIYMWMYKKITAKLHYISTQYTSTGYSLSDVDVVLNVLSLTFVYALVRSVVIAL